MTRISAIAGREFASFFRTPVGWVVTALFLLITGTAFSATLTPGEPASMRAFFSIGAWLVLFIAPAVSMRLLAEEQRSGTIEALMTAPVSEWQVVAGKYLGGAAFLVAMLAPTLAYPLVLEGVADPDWGPILAGYTGLLLPGLFQLAVGTLFSSATSNQIVAFLGAVFFVLLFHFATTSGAAQLGEPWRGPLFALAFAPRLEDFARGVIDTAHVAYFLILCAWFVAAAAVVMESRRWR